MEIKIYAFKTWISFPILIFEYTSCLVLLKYAESWIVLFFR